MAKNIVSVDVDDAGRGPINLHTGQPNGRFGENIKPGAKVTVYDEDEGTVIKVYDHIQTRNNGSNYVYVDVAVGE